MIKTFSTEHLNAVFAEDGKYEAVRNLMFDLAQGREIYDGDRKVSVQDANDKLRKVTFEILDINENSTKRDRKRAIKRHGVELFEVMEDVIDLKVVTGWKESEFFNTFVEQRNLALGDSQEFWVDDDVILSVAKVSGDHHDISMQTLGSGQSFTVSTSVYASAVGADIDLYLTGRIDWSKLTDACARAFTKKIMDTMYAEVMAAGAKLPAQFKGTGALTAATKDAFDMLLENVQMANDGAALVIMGTKTALKQLSKLTEVDWISNGQKEEMAQLGRLGSYEGTTLLEIPQRFADNDITKKLVDNKKLLIMSQVDNKFVKFVDVGETEISEITDKGELMDDMMKYEVKRAMGITTIISRYFGEWTLA